MSRGPLIDLLVDGWERPITLLDAPAGYGKTTLLAQWCASVTEDRRVAWLSLDDEDNDPVRFWSSVIEALGTVEPGVGEQARSALQAPNVALAEVALPLIVNDLARIHDPVVLVLDDYHLIREERVHRSLGYLIEHLPATLHLAIATRSDPPLPLGRLRAHGEMTEIRAAELRMTDEEAAGLLQAALGIELDRSDVARLQERTEGWAAGLYLAALSVRGREDVRGFIESFAGDNRHIVDYLSAEVLAGQPREVRDFLLRSSVLDRLCGPLCDAVTGSGDSARTLERIESFNLFLVPLDRTRHWYRYHHLFRELLRHELRRTEPDAEAALHRRAHDWYRENGFVGEAIQHGAAAGHIDGACELIAAHWNAFFNEGRLDTVAGWLAAIPREAASGDPRLCVAGAWLALDRGKVNAAEHWIAGAEAENGAVGTEAAVLRAVYGFKVGDVRRAHEAARHVLELGPAEDSFACFVANCLLGVTLYWGGDPAAAEDALETAVGLARQSGNDLGQSYALGYLALVGVERGGVDKAERLARTANGLSDDPGFVEHFVTMIGHLALGRAEESRGRLAEAEEATGRALELARRGAGALELARALIAHAQVRHSRGDRAQARELMRQARRTVERCADAGTLEQILATVEHGLHVSQQRAAPNDSAAQELTERELAVLRLLGSELSRREIGAQLYVSLDTVKTHVRGIYRKLGASTRAEAVERARALHLL